MKHVINITQMLVAAAGYATCGWIIHPLSKPDDKGDSPGKKPVLKGWQFLAKTPDDIEAYIEKGYNVGLVCGKASGVDAIDFDVEYFKDDLFNGFEVDTLISGHRDGRGHVLFQHRDDIYSERHHFIGIEYFGNNKDDAGSNLVLPPSIHYSGEIYKWKNPNTPLANIPDRLRENLITLFKREDVLHDYFKKCRHCFTKGSNRYPREDPRSKGLWDRPDNIAVHGMDGRRAIIAIMGELRNVGCPDDLMHMACKRFFGKAYKFKETEDALKHIKPIPPKCETLRRYLSVECSGCTWRPGAAVAVAEGSVPLRASENVVPLRYRFVVLDSAKMVGELFPLNVQNIDGSLCTTNYDWYKRAIEAGAIGVAESSEDIIKGITIVHGSILTDPIFFDFETSAGVIRMRDTDAMSYSKFRVKYLVTCKKMLPHMDKATWERLIEALIQDADDITDTPDEDFITTQILNLVSRCDVVLDKEDLIKGSGLKAWKNEGVLWVSSTVIDKITQERKVTLRKVRELLKTHLKGSTKQWRIAKGRYYLWPFDAGILEGK